ncbi:MAG: PHP domain-containing protein [Chloroflexota bacterium]|nr:PHP domain-containing protein [Chloroflexota bacterium]
MKIDLHVHSTCSDGAFSVEEILQEAQRREVDLLSITDHDSIDGQQTAVASAAERGMWYVPGVELNVTFEYQGKPVSLDFLGYRYDIQNGEMQSKLRVLREHREARAREILKKLNAEFDREGIERLTNEDLRRIEESVDGTFGRPHIANYLVQKGVVRSRKQAFDRYLVKCDVPKYPLSLAEASALIRNAGGVLVHAHPADPNGTSLATIARDISQQTDIIEQYMLEYIDGIECWHSRLNDQTTAHYVAFVKKHGLIATGGSDCHQKPVVLGTLDIPDWVAGQFR